MTPAKPERLREYNGPITRGARWDAYRPRPGDIIISAPAKSGMTWTQAICAMLIFGRADTDVQPAKISPWFDSKFEPLGEMLKRLEAQKHRRYLKTHTPLDGLPYFPEVSYLAVYRHPLDAFYSMASLRMREGGNTVRARMSMPPDIRSFILACIGTPHAEGVGEQLSVASVAQHLMSFWPWRDSANVHLFHYADMTRDLAGSIRAIASAIGIALDDGLAEAMVAAASFANMRAHAQQFAPESGGAWNNAEEFFATGKGGRWKDALTEEDVVLYRRALETALPDAVARAWLENGGGWRAPVQPGLRTRK